MLETRQDVVANGLRHVVHHFAMGGGDDDEAANTIPYGRAPRVVVFLHGLLDSGATSELLATHLVHAGYEVIAPDLRGFGATERAPAGAYYHFPDYVADVDDLIDTLVPSRGPVKPWLAVVGHSMGGTIAAMWAGARPERLNKLVLLEGLGPPEEDPANGVERMRGWLTDLGRAKRRGKEFKSVDEAITRLAATHPSIDRSILATRAARLVTPTSDGGVRWSHDPLHRTRSPIPFQLPVFTSYLKAITCPTLFVDGGEKGWRVPDEAARLASIRNAARASLPTAGHMMHWTQPAELAEELLTFFRRD